MLKKDRKYYRIGQASEIIGVEPHILRFWEKQFKEIKPRRISGQRLYRAKDLEILKRIKELLYHEGYTIPGAQKRLREKPLPGNGQNSGPGNCKNCKIIEEIRDELIKIEGLLKRR